MQLRDLEYVVAIAQTGSFSKAAAQMFVSQPALSQAVARLEEEFGLQIFYRTRGVITPTEAGRVLLEDGLSILQMSDRIHKRMSDVQNLRTGQVSIGISHLYGKYYFSRIMPIFRERFPGIIIHIVEDTSSQLEKKLEAGVVDIAFFSVAGESEKLVFEFLFHEELLFGVPPGHPINSCYKHDGDTLPVVDLELFKNDDFLMIKRGQRLYTQGHMLCARAGFVPHVVFETGNSELANTFIAGGLGVGFLPIAVRCTCQPEHRAVYYLLSDPEAKREYVVAYNKHRFLSLAARQFIEVAKEISHQFGDITPNRKQLL